MRKHAIFRHARRRKMNARVRFVSIIALAAMVLYPLNWAFSQEVPKPSKAELRKEREREFKEMLENATLKGTWQVVGPGLL